MNSEKERILNEINKLSIQDKSIIYEYLYRNLSLRCAPELKAGMCVISFKDDKKYLYKERIVEKSPWNGILPFDIFIDTTSGEKLQMCLIPPPAIDPNTYVPYRYQFKAIYKDATCTDQIWPVAEQTILNMTKETTNEG